MPHAHRQTVRPRSAAQRGFTLIELVITVAIIAILATIALPSYREYILKSRRADAKNAVLDLAARQERFFSIHNTYTSSAVDLGYGASATFPQAVNVTGASFYEIETVATPSSVASGAFVPGSFIATARPIGSQTADVLCYAYRTDSLGRQANLDATGATIPGVGCW